MKYRPLIPLLLFLCLVTACRNHKAQTLEEKRKELHAGLLKSDGSYSADEIGWTVQLPQGWNVIKKAEIKKMKSKGKEAMEKTLGAEIDDSDVVELISIKKDQINSFLSNMQKPDTGLTSPGYDERVKFVFDAVKEAYQSKGVEFEALVGATRIGGIMFDRLEIKFFKKDKKEIAFYQDMYIAPVNGYDFSMFTTYNNEEDMQTLWNVLHSSTFVGKDGKPVK